MTSTFQLLRSAKREYIRYRSPAKIAASSPPVPARISKNTLLSSCGSLGSNKVCNSCSSVCRVCSAVLISSCAIAFMSLSESLAISCAVSKSSTACKCSVNLETIGPSCAYSLDSLVNSFWLLMTSGSESSAEISS